MKKIYLSILLIICSLPLVAKEVSNMECMQEVKPVLESCNSGENNRLSESAAGAKRSFTVNGVTFNMIRVEGGTFTMGATPEQRNPEDDEKPPHRVTLSSYMIGETEVTQALWQAVMGKNIQQIAKENGWNTFGEGDDYPMYDISWYDCQDFVRKLNSLTGLRFRLPTEAEWEFAARGGNKSKGYQYSGSNNIDHVALYGIVEWTTRPVAKKAPNELGIYDMSGSMYEWCKDWYGNYSSSAQKNPQGPTSGSLRVIRGGSWNRRMEKCRSAYRNSCDPDVREGYIGLRLVLSEKQGDNESSTKGQQDRDREQIIKVDIASHEGRNNKRSFTVRDVTFNMIRVEGGTFTMGATPEQQNPIYDEWPIHRVTLDSYMIGETEVTQELWRVVTGKDLRQIAHEINISSPSGTGIKRPMHYISWNDCQDFISKLNSLTGQRFRLPTETEWEFAARGGNMSKGYQYSGSDTIDDVATYYSNTFNICHTVASKAPNELGIYDMSGNVEEWCQDWYGYYNDSAQTNPRGPSKGSHRVTRGGNWEQGARCQLTSRNCHNPNDRTSSLGLRLVLCDMQANNEVLSKDTLDRNCTQVTKDDTEGYIVRDKNRSTTVAKGIKTASDKHRFTVNGVSFNMICVEGGTFAMGATPGLSPYIPKKAGHRVTLNSYMIGETEVTQKLWLAVMGYDSSEFEGSRNPVDRVTWDNCLKFIRKLSFLTGQTFRLPTEAEWEFAARGGNKSKGYKHSGSKSFDKVGWRDRKPHPVATKAPNELGIYDMSGNVSEWCQDFYVKEFSLTHTNPMPGPSIYKRERVYRGSNCGNVWRDDELTYRGHASPDVLVNLLGLRLALSEYNEMNVIPKTEEADQEVCNNTGKTNGHEWADLGLPSGIKWATCNIGASSPEGYGYYFAWGKTKPMENGRDFSDRDKYTIDNKTTLDPEDDAAHVNWGGDWRMPTFDEVNELRTKCNWTWTTRNGLNGHKVTGPNGNSIFLPAAGYRNDSGLNFASSCGYYWSSWLSSNFSNMAYYLYFSGYETLESKYRSDRCSVRPVCQ